jgi:anthranilate phosphoribosyltransferase
MKYYLSKLISGQNLNFEEAKAAILSIGLGEVNGFQIASFLTAVQVNGLSVDELLGFREGMLELALNLPFNEYDAIDVCGTGGDGKDTFNISTTASFLVAGAGQKVAKHGNHGVSSAVGSSTVLETLGVKFTNDIPYLKNKLETAGICYLHAPLFHPAMKYVAPVRKDLGIRTFFNILGPLLNPAGVKKQFSGVSDIKTLELYAEVFRKSGIRFGVVHSVDIYDEISLTDEFVLATENHTQTYDPQSLGFRINHQQELHGGDSAKESAQIIINILKNQGTEAQTNAVLANAGVALSIARKLSLKEGIEVARESLESGQALKSLELLVL